MSDEGRGLWEASASAWIANVDRDVNRTVLLDPVIAELVDSVHCRRVLDLGCGEGRSLRKFVSTGALRVGIDPTAELLERARDLDDGSLFIRASAEVLPFRAESFDLVLAVLVLIDIPDFSAAIAEAARVLAPGGHLLAVNLSSFMTTTASGWIKDDQGRKLHVPVDDYFTERPITLEWAGIRIINWHRPLEAYMHSYLSQGLRLVRFDEPRASAEQVREHPAMETEARSALFNVMLWQKP